MSDLDRRGFFRLLAGAAAMAVVPMPLIPVSGLNPDPWQVGRLAGDWRYAVRIANIDISDLVVMEYDGDGKLAKSDLYQDKGDGWFAPKEMS